MSARSPRDERLDHLSRLIQKVAWLEDLMEVKGDPRGHIAAEVAAISWSIETMRDLDPELAALLPRAEAIAEDRMARIRATRVQRAGKAQTHL